MKSKKTIAFLLFTWLGTACSVKTPPTTGEVVEDALPPTTDIPAEWTEPAGDTGDVDDGWLESFNQPELEALVQEAISLHNPNMRLISAQVDRATAAARLAGYSFQQRPVGSYGLKLAGLQIDGPTCFGIADFI